jgi:hypothetical protein
LRREFNTRLLNEVKNHLEKPMHPIAKLITRFNIAFTKTFSNLVETSTAESKQELMDRIKKQGDNFIMRVIDSVKQFEAAVFDSLIYLYDP